MKRKTPHLFVQSTKFGAVLVTALFSAGCFFQTDRSREITLEPHSRKIEYRYTFEKAYAAPSADGGYDLLLTSGFETTSPETFPQVLPAVVPATSQVLHVHLSWKPASGAKTDHPAAANSTISWQLFHGEPSTTPNRALYTGTGFVSVEPGGETTEFDLRTIEIKLHDLQGDMRDPLGPSHISGVISAQNNEPAVRKLLRKLEGDSPIPGKRVP